MDNQDRLGTFGYMANWAARMCTRLLDREIASVGVSPGHLTVFFALGDGRAMTTTALARAASIEQPTMTQTLSRMGKLGLVKRVRHESDARSTLFSLTEDAHRKAAIVEDAVHRVEASVLEALPAARRESFLDDLRTIVLHMDRLANGPGEAASPAHGDPAETAEH